MPVAILCTSIAVTPQETLWHGWEMTDGMSGMDETKVRVQKGSKKKCTPLSWPKEKKPQNNISSQYWIRTKPLYWHWLRTIVLKTRWWHVTTLEMWVSAETDVIACHSSSHFLVWQPMPLALVQDFSDFESILSMIKTRFDRCLQPCAHTF